jgi:hypothetical protein
MDQITGIIQQGIREGVFRPVEARAVAEMFVSASIGMVEQEFASGTSRSIEQAVDALMGIFLHGLCANQPELGR